MDMAEGTMLPRDVLTGNAIHTIDAKGRIVVPSKFRDALGYVVFATRSPDGCIRLYPEFHYLRMLDKLCKGDVSKTALRRRISGRAEQLRIDSQGRLLVPEAMRLAAGITDKVCMVGMVEWLELWDETALAEAEAQLSDEEAERMMAELGMA